MKTILDVPKIKQLKNHCGPASLSMAVKYHGSDISQEEIAEYFGGSNEVSEKGTYYRDLANCARKIGFKVYESEEFSLDRIVQLINIGLPIIARIKSNRDYTHFCLIRGYEKNPNVLWINDPDELSKRRELYENFSRRWKIRENNKSSRYGLVIGLDYRKIYFLQRFPFS